MDIYIYMRWILLNNRSHMNRWHNNHRSRGILNRKTNVVMVRGGNSRSLRLVLINIESNLIIRLSNSRGRRGGLILLVNKISVLLHYKHQQNH